MKNSTKLAVALALSLQNYAIADSLTNEGGGIII